jgi:hypothetical protein
MSAKKKLTPAEVEELTFKAIKKIINKFRENPRYFFSESDLHSYFYYCIYSRKMEFSSDGIPLQAVHREYPTNFRYSKKALKAPCFKKIPDNLFGKDAGSRGHYDFAVLNPIFIENSLLDWKHIRNKEVALTDARREDGHSFLEELLFAIEFKYVIHDSKAFIDEVVADNNKLRIARKTQCKNAVNLVFCDLPLKSSKNLESVKEAVEKADKDILTIFINSYYDENGKKITPKPETNDNKNAERIL